MPSLSIVIPAYDEEDSIGSVLKDIQKNLHKYFSEFEVIVVDDGSTDNTAAIAESFAKLDKRIKVLQQQNSGYNQAMITGIKAAKKDYIGYMQGDGQNRVQDMVKCYKILAEYDLVLGSRGTRTDYNLLRKTLHYGSLAIYRILFGFRYEDPHWVYFWKRKELQKLQLDPKGGVFLLAESLVKFRRKGLKIAEVPTLYRSRMGGQQKAVRLEVIIRSMRSIFRLWWKIKTGKE